MHVMMLNRYSNGTGIHLVYIRTWYMVPGTLLQHVSYRYHVLVPGYQVHKQAPLFLCNNKIVIHDAFIIAALTHNCSAQPYTVY